MTSKQQQFIAEYLIDLNATEAAKRAGYSAKTAYSIGQQLLKKFEIQEAIKAAQLARSERTHITQDAVLQEIALLSHSDYTNYVIDDEGNLLVREGVNPLATRAVSSVKKKVTRSPEGDIVSVETEFKLWNKPASVKMAGDHLGLLKDHVEISGNPEQPLVVAVEHRLRDANSRIERLRRASSGAVHTQPE